MRASKCPLDIAAMRACECPPDMAAMRACECPPDMAAMRACECPPDMAAMRACECPPDMIAMRCPPDMAAMRCPPDMAAMRACECPPDMAAMRACEYPPDMAARGLVSALRILKQSEPMRALCEGGTVRASCETECPALWVSHGVPNIWQPATLGQNPALVPNPTSDRNGFRSLGLSRQCSDHWATTTGWPSALTNPYMYWTGSTICFSHTPSSYWPGFSFWQLLAFTFLSFASHQILWNSQIEIKYRVLCCVYHCIWSAVLLNFRAELNICFIDTYINIWCILEAHMNPTLKGKSAIQRFNCSEVTKICDGIMFDSHLDCNKSSMESVIVQKCLFSTTCIVTALHMQCALHYIHQH